MIGMASAAMASSAAGSTVSTLTRMVSPPARSTRMNSCRSPGATPDASRCRRSGDQPRRLPHTVPVGLSAGLDDEDDGRLAINRHRWRRSTTKFGLASTQAASSAAEVPTPGAASSRQSAAAACGAAQDRHAIGACIAAIGLQIQGRIRLLGYQRITFREVARCRPTVRHGVGERPVSRCPLSPRAWLEELRRVRARQQVPEAGVVGVTAVGRLPGADHRGLSRLAVIGPGDRQLGIRHLRTSSRTGPRRPPRRWTRRPRRSAGAALSW